MSADTLNNRSENGENLTPLLLIDSVHRVFPFIELDPASCQVANKYIQGCTQNGVIRSQS